MFNRFFHGTVFLYFTKLAAETTYKRTFSRRFNVEYMYVCRECICQIFKAYCNFKGALAAIHLSGTVIISRGHLQ